MARNAHRVLQPQKKKRASGRSFASLIPTETKLRLGHRLDRATPRTSVAATAPALYEYFSFGCSSCFPSQVSLDKQKRHEPKKTKYSNPPNIVILPRGGGAYCTFTEVLEAA